MLGEGVPVPQETRSATVCHERLSDWLEVFEQHAHILRFTKISCRAALAKHNTNCETQTGNTEWFPQAHDAYLWPPAVTLLLILQQAVATLREPHRVGGRVLQTQTAAIANQHLKVVCTTGAEVGGSSSRSKREKIYLYK